jgi:hypothetical protein
VSKLETPMIQAYWEKVGGTLIEEFPVVMQTPTCSARRLDAVILPDGETRIASSQEEIPLVGRDVIIVHCKAERLDMDLAGQTVFSAELIKPFQPASVRSVVLCAEYDSVIGPLLEEFPHVEVVVLPVPAESPVL